jgi:ribosomal protein S14
MVGFKKYQNVPFNEIPKKDRVKAKTLAICQGGCNRLSKINTTTYQLCLTCSGKWRYHGHSCDVPNCESVADGSIAFHTRENKMACGNCYRAWKRMDFCIWERFVEERHLWLLRPETFVKALEEGFISPVKKKDRVKQKEIAECHHCYRESKINNPTYQLCGTCLSHLQHHGETCGVCEVNDAVGFDTPESIFVCLSCQAAKQKYKLTSYHIYKTQIRTINNCQICNDPVSHDAENGNDRCSANIDHDHDTGITRGVLCSPCNQSEGIINTWAENLNTDLLGVIELLKDYLENPPLSKSWVQKS